jgi:hypothetical protein
MAALVFVHKNDPPFTTRLIVQNGNANDEGLFKFLGTIKR